jgi:hypothetical protein
MEGEKAESTRLVCGRCGLIHATSGELLNNKLSLDYSYSLIGFATDLSPRWVRMIIKGKAPISCRTNKKFLKWLETASPQPWLSIKGREAVNKESIRAQKKAGKTDLWLKTDSFAFEWKLFQCKGCKGLFVGLMRQTWCTKCGLIDQGKVKRQAKKARQARSLNSLKTALQSTPIFQQNTQPDKSPEESR